MNWQAWTMAAALTFSGSLYAQMEGEDDVATQVDAQITKYDTNKDGKVTKVEYREVERAESGEPEDSYEWLEKWKFSLIDFLASDSDDNLEVTREELTIYFERVMGGESEKFGKLTKADIGVLDEEYLEPFNTWIMGKLDTDKNGKISKKEADDAGAPGVMEYDANKDGSLDAMEIKQSEVTGIEGLYEIEEGYTLKGEPSTAEKADPNEIPETVRAEFEKIDADKDGKISKAEIKTARMKGQTNKAFWWGVYIGFLAMDADDDLHVTLDEFAGYLRNEANGVPHKFYPADRAEAMNEIWLDLDGDKDGKVTKAEWDKMFPGNDEFEGLDADNSGDTSKDEFWDGMKGQLGSGFEFPDKDRDAGTIDEGTPNPDDPAWSLYKKEGRSWMVKSTSKFMGIENVSYMITEVTKVAADHCVIRVTMLDKDKKPFAGMQPTETKIHFKTASAGGESKAKITDLGTETIKVEAGEIECQVTQVEVEVAGAKHTTKSWMHKKYAGLVVKSESTSDQSTSTSELVEFNE